MQTNILRPNASQSEIIQIDDALARLFSEMRKYLLDAKYLWDTEFRLFIESTDCLILGKLLPQDHKMFIDFMCEQRTFKIMQLAHKRLISRRTYLESNN